MFSSARNFRDAYARIGLETGVAGASSHQLVLMLYEGAMIAVASARTHMQIGQTAHKGEAISKAAAIIDCGLRASLDMDVGGDLPHRLSSIYDYMVRQLVRANVENRPEPLDEVGRLLAELNDAWKAIGRRPQAAGASVAVPASIRT